MTTTTPTAARKPQIGAAFDKVAARYDLMCSLNPGYHKQLRYSAQRLEAPADGRILDLCCGTGLSTTAVREVYPGATITGLDISHDMLAHAETKEDLAGIEFLEGDAMDPAAVGADGPYDAILMAYGLRNVPDPDACLARLRELLVPGGTLCLHEYSVADSRRSRWTWNAVSFGIVIPLSAVVTRSTDIFRYLRKSVLEFDGVVALEQRLRDAGFEQVETLAMDGWAKDIQHTFRARRPR